MTRRHRGRLAVECLELRDVPATLVSPTTVTYQDVDGDNVVVRLSKPLLTAVNVDNVFTFAGGTPVNGDNTTKQQLQLIDLANLGPTAAGIGMTTVATPSPVNGGDGFASLGHI